MKYLIKKAVAAQLDLWRALREIEDYMDKGDTENADELIATMCCNLDNAEQVTDADAEEFIERLRYEE